MPEYGQQASGEVKDVVRIPSLGALRLYTSFLPDHQSSVGHGFILAEPVLNERDIMVYPAGTEISHKEISRLIRLKETSTNFEPSFLLNKNIELIKNCRERLTKDFNRLLQSKMRNAKFADFMQEVEKTLKFYLDGILGSDDVVYALSQLRMEEQSSSEAGTPTRYFNHSINTMLYSLGIAKNSHRLLNFQYDNFINLSKTALFHNVACITRGEELAELGGEALPRKYYEVNLTSHDILSGYGFERVILNAIKMVSHYYTGHREFIQDKENPASRYASIVLTASMFNVMESGLISDSQPMKDVLDNMYSRVMIGEIEKDFLDSLASALKQRPLVDFYGELDKLKATCTLKKADEYPSPYPLSGFKSAVVFLCKGNRGDCPDFGTSKAVNVVKKTSGLEPGSYGICVKMTVGLRGFYERFYPEIKEVVHKKDN